MLAVGVAAVLGAASASQAILFTATTTLSGAAEAPPNGSPGTGVGRVDYDTVARTMRVRTTFSGLLGTTTAAHIHAATAVPGVGTAMVATQTPSFAGFPLGVTSGSMDTTFDMSLASSYNPAFIAAHGGTVATAEAFFIDSLNNGTAYLNLHTTSFTSGEIRGFLQVPAPSAAALLGLGGLIPARRRTR
ncbi:MAG: CHRD domain-containing protein [Pyrinomonadaceae bacterium]|nr:CHRD domain-containing protein [Phycisphaerales bacterium]